MQSSVQSHYNGIALIAAIITAIIAFIAATVILKVPLISVVVAGKQITSST